LLLPLQIRTFLVGDSDQEITKWNSTSDELSPEYKKYYEEDNDSDDDTFFEIDLSKFGGNGTNFTNT
jgi:hypothetical protein